MGKMPSEFKQSQAAAHPIVFRFYRLPVPCTKLATPERLPRRRAMIWHVNSTTGSDANDGRSSGAAFKTLAHAVEAAKAGDTIMIAPGAYDQDLPGQVSLARAANVVVVVAGSD